MQRRLLLDSLNFVDHLEGRVEGREKGKMEEVGMVEGNSTLDRSSQELEGTQAIHPVLVDMVAAEDIEAAAVEGIGVVVVEGKDRDKEQEEEVHIDH